MTLPNSDTPFFPDAIAFRLPPGGHHDIIQGDFRTWPVALGVASDFEHAVDAYDPGDAEMLVVECVPHAVVVQR